MASEICIPRLGWNMEEGTFLGWLRVDGEGVRSGEPLFTLEGEKAAQDVEAAEDGILRIDPAGPNPGDVVAVGAVIGLLLQPGESPPAGAPRVEPGRPEVSPPAAGGLAVATRATVRGRPRSSPLARRIAREMDIDWTALRGSGRDGRIRKADVLAAARVEAAPDDAPARSVPVGPIRRTIASRMVESRSTTAPVTLTTAVDASNLVNLREQFRAAGVDCGGVPGYTDFIARLTALALRDHPLLNARWQGDEIRLQDEVNLGIAVDTEAGLLVPVIRGADRLGLRPIAERSRELVERARSGRLSADEMRGGTFTITNLGSFGVDAFTPIINPPECAILGLGRIAKVPTMVGERVEGRDRLTLSLTFDHRIVDGAAARFLQDLGRRIENPGPWLLS